MEPNNDDWYEHGSLLGLNLRLWVGSLSISEGYMVPHFCILAWLGLKVWSRNSLLMFLRVVKILRTSHLDAQDKCSFAEWACWNSHTSAFFHSSRCKHRGPTSFWKKVPQTQTYHCQESNPSGSCQNLRRSGDTGRRVPYSSGTSTTTGSNK